MASMSDIGRGARVVFDPDGMRVYTPGQYRPARLRPKRRKPGTLPSQKTKRYYGPARKRVRPGRSGIPAIKPFRRIGRISNFLPGPARLVWRAADFLLTPPWVSFEEGGYDIPPYFGRCNTGVSGPKVPCWGQEWNYVSISGGGCLLRCQTFQVPTQLYGETIVLVPAYNSFHFGDWSGPPSAEGTRMDYDQTYVRGGPGVNGTPNPIPNPIVIPFLPGRVTPIVAAEPQPYPEYGVLTTEGFGVPGRTRALAPRLDPRMSPRTKIDIGGDGYVPPGVPAPTEPGYISPAWHWDSRQGKPTPGYHKRVPDRSNKGNLGTGTLGGVYGGITEIADTVNDIAKAIPGQPCRNVSGLHNKIACVFNHAAEIDPVQAGINIAQNKAEDRIIGFVGNLPKKGVRNAAKHGYYNSPAGLTTGSAYTRPPGVTMTNL